MNMTSAILDGKSTSTSNENLTLDLLQRLEQAISNGQHQTASMMAAELAKMKADCSMTVKRPEIQLVGRKVDGRKTRVRVQSNMTVGALRTQIYEKYKVPVRLMVLGAALPFRKGPEAGAENFGVVLENDDAVEGNDFAVIENDVVRVENDVAVFENDVVLLENDATVLENDVVVQENDVAVQVNHIARPENDVAVLENYLPDHIALRENDPAVRENDLAVLENYLAGQENDVAVLENYLPVLENDVAVLENYLTVDDNDVAVHEDYVAVPQNVLAEQQPDNTEMTKEREFGEEKWACSKCTYLNEFTERCCSMCLIDRLGTSNPEVIPIACSSSSFNVNKISPMAEVSTKGCYSNYLELLDMENTDLVTNMEAFECPICLTVYHPGDGVVLKTCLHSFCRDCLRQMIEASSDAEIRCPYVEDFSCGTLLQDREIRALVSAEMYDRYLNLCMNEAESKMANTFHCKTPNCKGWCVFENDVNEFICPACQHKNCLTCQAIHEESNCQEYQLKIMTESANDPQANKTRQHLEDMLKKGQAMLCPTCKIIILKRSGCDAITCTICKTQICWITKGPRWGPKGIGDTSGGCGCSYMKKCHPNCHGCH